MVEVCGALGASRLVVGVLNGYTPRFMSPIVARFMELEPNVILELHYFSTNQRSFDLLKNRAWDLVVTLLNDDFLPPSDSIVEHVAATESTVYCAADHPLAKMKHVSIEQMAEYSWVVTTLGSGESFLKEKFAEHNLIPKIVMRTNSIPETISIVQSAPLLCLAPSVSAAVDIDRGDIAAVDQDIFDVRSNVSLVYSTHSIRTAAMRSFMAICKTDVHTRLQRLSNPESLSR